MTVIWLLSGCKWKSTDLHASLASLLTFSTQIPKERQKPSAWWFCTACTLCLLWNVGSNRAMPHKVSLLEDKYTVSVSLSLSRSHTHSPHVSALAFQRAALTPRCLSCARLLTHSYTLHTNKLQPERDERDIEMSFISATRWFSFTQHVVTSFSSRLYACKGHYASPKRCYLAEARL